MILSDIEIKAELQGGIPRNGMRDENRLIIDPMPADERITSASIDLTLDNLIWELPEKADYQQINPAHPQFRVNDLVRQVATRKEHTNDEQYVLKRNRLVLGQTHERVQLPLHLGARIEGKSSLARLGMSIHATAPTVQPGFNGRLTLEINNVGPFPVVLTPKMLIAQLIVERVGLPVMKAYKGQFQGQG